MKNKNRRSEILTAYFMLLPNLILFLVFLFFSIGYAFFVSLHDWNGISSMKFVKFHNYVSLLSDDKFWHSLWVTLKYTLVYVPSVYVIALALALMVNAVKGFYHRLLRTVFFLPFAVSSVVAGLTWSFMYDPKRGYFNQILNMFGIGNQSFLASMDQALYAVAAVGIWLVVGYNMIIFLTALKDIPKSYFEAAEIDGANSFVKFFRITLPSIKNISVFVLIVTTIGSFQVFDQIKVMTGGGPAQATNVSVYYIYQQAFELNKIGYATAVSFILFLVILLFSMVQFKFYSLQDEDGRKS